MQIYIPDVKEEIKLAHKWSFIPMYSWRLFHELNISDGSEITFETGTVLVVASYEIRNNNRESFVRFKTKINSKVIDFNVKLTDVNRLLFNRKETDGVLNLKLNFWSPSINKGDNVTLPLKLRHYTTFGSINEINLFRIDITNITTKEKNLRYNGSEYKSIVVDKIKHRLSYIDEDNNVDIIIGEWYSMQTIRKKAKEYLKEIDLTRFFDKYQKETYKRFTRKEKFKNVIID